jgi:hypothetical protein
MSLPVRPRWLVAPLLSALLLGVAPVLPAAAEPVDPAPAVAAEPVDSGLAPLAEPASYPVPEQRASLAAAAGLPQYSLVDLGAGTTSNAAEVNEQGHVAGTLFESTGEQPVLWRGDEVVRLDTGGAKLVRALSLGDDGTVGGWMYDATAGKRYAVAWRPDEDGDYGKLQRVSEVSSYQSSLSGGEVQSVGARGELHVTEPRQHVPFGSDAVLQGSEVTELGPLSAAGPAVGTYDLSANGVFATGLAGDGKSNVDAAVWTAGSPVLLPDPLRDAGVARGPGRGRRGRRRRRGRAQRRRGRPDRPRRGAVPGRRLHPPRQPLRRRRRGEVQPHPVGPQRPRRGRGRRRRQLARRAHAAGVPLARRPGRRPHGAAAREQRLDPAHRPQHQRARPDRRHRDPWRRPDGLPARPHPAAACSSPAPAPASSRATTTRPRRRRSGSAAAATA